MTTLKNEKPLVSWTYKNGEWREMLEHRMAYSNLEHQISVKRQQIAIASFLVGGLCLFVVMGIVSNDWLSALTVAAAVAGIGAGLIAWNYAGEKKQAKINLKRWRSNIENHRTPIIEISKSGIKSDIHLLFWGADYVLTSVSIVEQPMKAVRFDYFLGMEPYQKDFAWIPIPRGQEHAAQRLVQELNG